MIQGLPAMYIDPMLELLKQIENVVNHKQLNGSIKLDMVRELVKLGTADRPAVLHYPAMPPAEPPKFDNHINGIGHYGVDVSWSWGPGLYKEIRRKNGLTFRWDHLRQIWQPAVFNAQETAALEQIGWFSRTKIERALLPLP